MGSEGVKVSKADKAGGAGKPGTGERSVKREPGARPAKKEQLGAGWAGGEKPSKARAPPAAAPAPAAAAAAPAEASVRQAGKPAPAPKSALAAIKAEQQQERAGSNPTSLQRDGGAEQQQQRHALQQATSRPAAAATAPPAAAKQEPRPGAGPAGAAAAAGAAGSALPDQGSTELSTPVELLLAPAEPAQPMGELVVSVYRGHSELREALMTRFAGGPAEGEDEGFRL